LRCERTEILSKKFRNSDAEICIRRIVECDNKEKWHKIGIHMTNVKIKERGW
jgi:hypothetical protein